MKHFTPTHKSNCYFYIFYIFVSEATWRKAAKKGRKKWAPLINRNNEKEERKIIDNNWFLCCCAVWRKLYIVPALLLWICTFCLYGEVRWEKKEKKKAQVKIFFFFFTARKNWNEKSWFRKLQCSCWCVDDCSHLSHLKKSWKLFLF